MTRQEFKKKYFTNNFYWVNEKNHKQLQDIGIEFGCLNPLGYPGKIQWHEGFNNLGFRPNGDHPTKFQKEGFLSDKESATSFEEMLDDYKDLPSNKECDRCGGLLPISYFNCGNESCCNYEGVYPTEQ